MKPPQIKSIVFDDMGAAIRWLLDASCPDSPTGYYGPRRIAADLAKRLLAHPSIEHFAHIEVFTYGGITTYTLWTRKDWMDGAAHRAQVEKESTLFRAQSVWAKEAYERAVKNFMRLQSKVPESLARTTVGYFVQQWSLDKTNAIAVQFLHSIGFFKEPQPTEPPHHD